MSNRRPVDAPDPAGSRPAPATGSPRCRRATANHVQLGAVLRPVYGRLRTDADIADATAWAPYHWRRRAVQLAEAGCLPFTAEGKKSPLPNALACPVAFVMTYDKKLGRKPCKLVTVCPFCWAREVRRQWLTIDAAFFPPPPTAKRRVRVVDTDHGTSKSSSFTLRVKYVYSGPVVAGNP